MSKLKVADRPSPEGGEASLATLYIVFDEIQSGGREGIRTPDTLSGTPVFKTGAINHSATLPLDEAVR